MAIGAPPSRDLEVDDVSVSFEGLRALSNVSFDVSRGEIVGLIGPNGAGKTTAFNVICGFVKPTSGEIRFPSKRVAHQGWLQRSASRVLPARARRWAAGTATRVRATSLRVRTAVLRRPPSQNLRPSQLASAGVARTLQGVGLFPHLSVLENVMAGAQTRPCGGFLMSLLALPWGVLADRKIRADAFAQLERLDVSEFASRYPSQIPYGVAKKVALARALMCNPRLLLLDEPASGLDEAELDEFAALIVGLRKDMGVLLVEHDMSFVMPLVDRLVVLDFGEVIATGTPGEVQSNQKVIEAYLGVEHS